MHVYDTYLTQRCSQGFLRGGGRNPLAKLNIYWSIFTGVCFVESSIFTGVSFFFGGGGGGEAPFGPPRLHPYTARVLVRSIPNVPCGLKYN